MASGYRLPSLLLAADATSPMRDDLLSDFAELDDHFVAEFIASGMRGADSNRSGRRALAVFASYANSDVESSSAGRVR